MSRPPAQTVATPTHVSVASAGTAVQLTSTATLSDNIAIQALPGNTGNIYVGDSSTDSTHGWILVPGQFLLIEGSRRRDGSDSLDMSTIWINAATSGDSVAWGYLKR